MNITTFLKTIASLRDETLLQVTKEPLALRLTSYDIAAAELLLCIAAIDEDITNVQLEGLLLDQMMIRLHDIFDGDKIRVGDIPWDDNYIQVCLTAWWWALLLASISMTTDDSRDGTEGAA